MRFYYRGRTETVRSCTKDSCNWIEGMQSKTITNEKKIELFKTAINTHNRLMKEARDGQGFDRHLFALWCLSYENDIEIHPVFADPLYTKR